MISYNKVVEDYILYLGDIVLGTEFVSTLKRWREMEALSYNGIKLIQAANLNKLLLHAITNCPYYRGMQELSGNQMVPKISSFPLLTKDIIKNNLNKILDPNATDLVSEKSSGSSGVQGEVFMTRKEQYNAIATQSYLWEWTGYKLGFPLLQLGMTLDRSLIKSIKDRMLRTFYQQAFRIDRWEVLKAFGNLQNKDAFFGGYASALYAYACFAEESRAHVKFKAVISWGDKMFPHYRKKIGDIFGCKVYDTYGTTEGFIIAGQCEYENYHILTPHVYLELLGEDGHEVMPGEIGKVVVTRLDAYAMPLIRYELGDLAIKKDPDEVCSCGRPYPMLKLIIGRDTDIVRTITGKYLIVHFFTGIFEHIPEIKQFCVIQDNLEGINIEYIPGSNFSHMILSKIEAQIVNYIEEPFMIHFSEVQTIPPTPSGKPQIILSNLPKS